MTLFPWPYPNRKRRKPFSPSVRWARTGVNDEDWDLIVRLQDGRWSIVATVWRDGTWHTFDSDGVGGENDVEKSVKRAMVEAAASAIAQGFI